ncbi:MAG: AbrB/MazE/SpoVT family DNA-binding domain-containing protein [Acidobacteria bacterium]|nr:AbrB/MazE/SpoVT family DNA-binding domain-containing protein [Acidobacteriota bacterium]
MESKVQKWGNSLAVRIPKAFAEEAGLAENVKVDISCRHGVVVIKPKYNAMYELNELLSHVTPKNIHAEVDTGHDVGGENP